MKAELVPENGDSPIPITRDVTVVGRREYCDVVISDPSLSKRHCVVVKTDGLLVVRDLTTTNGTKVKGQKIRWAALLPDDRLALGSYKMRVYLGPDDAPAPSELPRSKGSTKAKSKSSSSSGDGEGRRPAPPQSPAGVTPGASWAIDHLPEDDDSGWRNLLPPEAKDDVVIELD